MTGEFSVTQIVAGAVGGFGAWFLTTFVAQPIRTFFALRSELADLLIRNKHEEQMALQSRSSSSDTSRQEARALALRFRSYAATNHSIARVLAMGGLDLELAADALMELEACSWNSPGIAGIRARAARALKIHWESAGPGRT